MATFTLCKNNFKQRLTFKQLVAKFGNEKTVSAMITHPYLMFQDYYIEA